MAPYPLAHHFFSARASSGMTWVGKTLLSQNCEEQRMYIRMVVIVAEGMIQTHMQVMLRLLMRHLDLGQPFYHSAGEIIAMSSLPYNIDEDHVGADSPTTDLTWTDETNRVTVITGVGNDRLQVSKGNPRALNDKTAEMRLTALKVPH